MKGKQYYIVLIFCLLATQACKQNKSQKSIPPLDETYNVKDLNPFGTYVAHHHSEQFFTYNTVRIKNLPFQKLWNSISDTGAVYLNIAKNIYLSEEDISGMLNYVNNGNTAFLCSQNIDTTLLDSLGVQLEATSNNYIEMFSDYVESSTYLDSGLFVKPTSFKYFYKPIANQFFINSNTQYKVLGYNNQGTPNFIVVFHGSGRFFLHCEPRLMSNYFLLQKDNYRYLENIFSYFDDIPEHVYWDDYYNKRNYPAPKKDRKTGLGMLMNDKAMSKAIWLLLFLVGLFILFESKRRQRVVPIIEPNKNTTVAFTETIGRLYLQEHNNKNIADKMIQYFYEQLRNQYFLNALHVNESFLQILSRKSNVAIADVKTLFNSIHTIQQSETISNDQLMHLNQYIERFNKNKI
ncbi:MAG: DUF4350 domain-containing protein [Ferruginibacter sp.]